MQRRVPPGPDESPARAVERVRRFATIKDPSPRIPSARLERPASFAARVVRSAPTPQATLQDFHHHHASARGGSNNRRARRPEPKPLVELRPAPPARHVANCDSDGPLLADQDHEPLAAGEAWVEEISLQHWVVLGHNRDDHRGIFRALALVDGGGVGGNQRIKFAEAVGHRTPVEARYEFARLGIDVVDGADVAVVDLLVVVILDLHDLVARGKGPAEPLDLAFAGGVQHRLQFDVERTRADAAAVHWAEHLDVADRVQAEPLGGAGLHQLYDALNGGLGSGTK